MTEDTDLVARAQAGDLDAFAELVRRYERRVRGVLFRLLDDDRDVEEATQDVFVQAWRSLDRFERRAQLFTWLYRIAVNEALMRRRRRRVQLAELDERLEAPGEETPELAQAEEERAVLLEAIRALPLEYRAPLVLRDIEGLPNEEVAEVLGLGLAAAKSRIHRARMHVRAALEEWQGKG